MPILFIRLIELREEYFNGLDKHDLHMIYSFLDKSKEYSSDELITIMGEYADMTRSL